jgi:hypothetical protein
MTTIRKRLCSSSARTRSYDHKEQPFINRLKVVANRHYSFPSITIFQEIARIFSKAATRDYHNRPYSVTRTTEAAHLDPLFLII